MRNIADRKDVRNLGGPLDVIDRLVRLGDPDPEERYFYTSTY